MSIDIVGGKVRGFVFQRDSGTAAPGTVAVLEAELDNNLWRPVGVLAADHAGYVSFSLGPLRAGGRTSVMALRVRTIQASTDIPAHASLTAPAPSFVLAVESAIASSTESGLAAIQEPDDVDREISPGSFATPPVRVSDGECGQLVPGGLASFDYGVYRVLRLSRFGTATDEESPESSRPVEALAQITTFMSGEASIGAVNVATPVDELPGVEPTLQVGLVLRFVQRWQPIGQSLGDIAYSLPLAPGEARDLAMIDWSRSDRISRLDEIDSSEQLIHDQHRDRSIEESINAGLHEHQEGWSFLAGTAGAASANIPIEAVNLSISGDHAIGVGISSTTGDRNLAGFSQQDLTDAVTQSTTVLRGLRSTVIVQADQNEANTVQTRTVANHNRCHALTIQYYEVLRTYRVTTQLAGADLALLVPHALVSFDEATALRWRAALQRNLLDPGLHDCFDALAHLRRCRDTAYNDEAPTTPTDPPPPERTYAATSYTVRLDTGPRQTWGSVWVNLVSEDGFRHCIMFKPNVSGVGVDEDEVDLVLNVNSVRTFVVSGNSDPVNGIGLDLRTVESVEVEWVEANGNDAWAFAGISVTATADGRTTAVLVNDKQYYGVRPYINRFDDSGHQHQVWAAPAKIEVDPEPSPDPTPEPTPGRKPGGRNLDEDTCCAAMLLGHLNDNRAYYSRVVWVGMDSTERRLRLVNALGRQVADAIDDRPLAVGGNQVAFQLNAFDLTDPRLAALIGSPKPTVSYTTVPARGVFAEAELGRCNACERRDATRMTEWSPVRPPEIGGVVPGPRGSTPAVEPTTLPGPVVQVVQAPNAPDPAGLGAALALLGTPNIFRDMSGRAELEQLLSGLVSGAVSLTEAQILARQVQQKQTSAPTGGGAGSGAGGAGGTGGANRSPAAETDPGRQVDRLDVIEQARKSGLISDADARGAALGVVGGEKPEGDLADSTKGVLINFDLHAGPRLRAFQPSAGPGQAADISGRVGLRAVVSNAPAGSTWQWAVAAASRAEIVSPAAQTTDVLAGHPGLVDLTFQVRDSTGTALASARTQLSVPQFVLITEDAAAFDAELATYHLDDVKAAVLQRANLVVEHLLRTVNVRTVWALPPFGAALPAQFTAGGFAAGKYNTLTIRGTNAGDPSTAGEVAPAGAGAAKPDEPISIWPGAYRTPGNDVGVEVANLVTTVSGLNMTDPHIKSLWIEIMGRLIGETMAHEICHALLAFAIPTGHNSPPVPWDLMNRGFQRSFLQRTGIEIVDRPNFPAPGSYRDGGIASISGLMPVNQGRIDAVFPVPPSFA